MNFKNNFFIFCFSIFIFSVNSCSLFDSPSGSCELLDVYTRNEQGYVEEYIAFGQSSSTQILPKKEEVTISFICTTVKITNTSNKNIYNSTINIQACAGDRTYYKTISLDVLIPPGTSIYIPVEIEKYTKQLNAGISDNDHEWDKSSIKILSTFWR